MSALRDDRAAAVRRYHRDIGDNLERALPRLLDALDEVDAKHGMRPQPDDVTTVSGMLTEEKAAALREQHPSAVARTAARRRTRT